MFNNIFNSKIIVSEHDIIYDKKTNKRIIRKSSLVSLFRVRELSISYYNKIQVLPDLRNLRILECSGSNIEYIPDTLIHLERLYCSDNHQLKHVPSLKNLRILFCDGCPLLIKLEKLPKLEKLNCTNCLNLEEIGPMPLLRFMDCSRNPQLFNISDQYSLEYLICERCYILDLEKSKMPNLINIRCVASFKLNLPPNLPKLEVLICDFARNIKLNHYKSLQLISSLGCPYFSFQVNKIQTVLNMSSYKQWCNKTNYIVVSFLLCLINHRLNKQNKKSIICDDIIKYKLKKMLL